MACCDDFRPSRHIETNDGAILFVSEPLVDYRYHGG